MAGYFRPETTLCPRCTRQYFIKDKPWKRVCLSCYFEEKNRAKAVPPAMPRIAPLAESIDDQMLRRLTFLCHPDKHDGSEASRLATQWLLEQKELRRQHA